MLMASDEEYLDVLTSTALHTGISKPRKQVHKDGDYHRAVHVWIYVETTEKLLLQKRADLKDSWPGLWDISSAGQICAGDTSVATARKELQEELGVTLPSEAFELLFVYLQERISNGGNYINNEFNDVYLVTILEEIPLDAFTLQESEVSMVKYIPWREYRDLLTQGHPDFVPYEVNSAYAMLFSTISQRYEVEQCKRQLVLKDKLDRYVSIELKSKLGILSDKDQKALLHVIDACKVLDEIFLEQVWPTNPSLKQWLADRQGISELEKLKYHYYLINKSPWSCLDDYEAFLTTADSAIGEANNAAKHVPGWKGVRYRCGFPQVKPAGGNFYPPDMDRAEFELWQQQLNMEEATEAKGFYTVIRRHSDPASNFSHDTTASKMHNLYVVAYSKEYRAKLTVAAEHLRTAASFTNNLSMKRLLAAKADAFISNNYFESDVAWIELDSPIDLTIGPYETYEDHLFGYKATFEAFIGIRDEEATSQVKLFSHHLQELEDNLPLDPEYKSEGVRSSPIRVVQLIYNAGDVKGPQTVAFNLPNDERIIKEHGSAMVMMKNVSEAKFYCILQPIAKVCLCALQQKDVDFESYFTHIVCHECCHGIGPHSIVSPDGRKTTVRLELQELHSSIEEAKADIVGLWALQYLLDKELLPKKLEKCMYTSFLAGCFRSIRFGLNEAHGKGQALQFNWILEKGGFIAQPDGTFAVDFSIVRDAVESLCREILTIQAQGDKAAARRILDTYAKITPELQHSLDILQIVTVPVDIYPSFDVESQLRNSGLDGCDI